MRSRSSKQAKETERLKLKEEPHLSGAYIRSLVKQLTSSRPKEPMNTKAPDGGYGDGFHPNLSNLDEGFSETPPQPQPSPQPKKQARRRLHTSRPYQERLLNMAEARREIVTALKFHRAAMKQANEQQQQNPPNHDPLPSPSLEPNERMKSRRSPRIYPSNTHHPTTPSTFSNYLNNTSLTPFFHPPPPPPTPFQWVSPPVAPLPLCDNINFTLPNQPLGLNLNFHDFNNIDTTFYQYNNNNHHQSIYTSYPSSSSSSMSSSSTSSPSPSLSCTEALSIVDPPPNGSYHSTMDDEEMAKIQSYHSTMDDEEMAKIRSIGDQHDMEWNDTLNLVTSARWFKFLKTMDSCPQSNEERGDEEGFRWFDEVMDVPAWLTAGVVGDPSESYFLEQHLDDFYSEDMMQDAALPCLDIGEIEGMDGEWLS